jgi:hypothetical protein
MRPMVRLLSLAFALTSLVMAACGDDDDMAPPPDAMPAPVPKDPATAPRESIDRFSAEAGHLMVRDASNGLPAAAAAINFDQAPFITSGLTPSGGVARYYNFDVQPDVPAPIYVLFEAGASEPIAGQLNIVDVVPGSAGYNDFWQVVKVTVPAGYVANTITSSAEITAAGLATETTSTLVNCPIVPDGSTATKRLGGEPKTLHQGWYRGKVVHYFSFEEAPLTAVDGKVPTSPIYVTFNINAGEQNGGPPSGFKTEADGMQTHNVIGSVPSDGVAYSPLWAVQIYDNTDFDQVSNLATANAATQLAPDVALVNCPVVVSP